MSTIVLPALRKPWHNLYGHAAAGTVTTTFVTPNFGGPARVKLTDVGLSVGDVVSASAEVQNAVSGENSRLNLRFEDASNVALQTNSASFANNTAFTRQSVQNATIPASTDEIFLYADRQSGAGAISIRNGSLNRGSTAAAFEHAKRGAVAPWVQAAFSRDNLQAVQLTNAGLSQITTWSSRRWLLQFDTHVLGGDELREWALALDQLSDLNNVFRIVPPGYAGPSTGYLGANPAVNGGSQLGTSLICDGVDASTAIVKAGDYASFEVTSPLSNTNVQLFRIAAPATSDGSGNVTLTLTTPIRQAPADNAVVQIFSPTAQMALVAPSAGVDYGMLKRARLQVAAEERIWP